MKKSSLSIRRRNARRFALQAIYQWEISQNSPEEVILYVYQENDFSTADTSHFDKLFKMAIDHVRAIDKKIAQHLEIKLTDLNPVELAVLRLGVCELTYCPDIPPKVVINEAIELAKEYGSVEGYRFVNGVLDAMVRK